MILPNHAKHIFCYVEVIEARSCQGFRAKEDRLAMVVQTLQFVPLAHALLGDLLVCYSSSWVAHVTRTTNLFESPRRLWSRDLSDPLLWPRIFLSFLDNSFRYTFRITYLGTLDPFRCTWPTQAHLGPPKLTWAHFGAP